MFYIDYCEIEINYYLYCYLPLWMHKLGLDPVPLNNWEDFIKSDL